MSKTLVKAAVATLVAIGMGSAVVDASAASKFEKCAGVAKAGHNDCGGKSHACAGQSRVDRDADDWIYLPEGTCGKIAGGNVIR